MRRVVVEGSNCWLVAANVLVRGEGGGGDGYCGVVDDIGG